MIEAQEKTISDLLQAVKEQHDQLDNQKSKIKILEEKVKTGQQNKQLLFALLQMGFIKFSAAYYITAEWNMYHLLINKLSYFFPAPPPQISYDSFQDTVDKSMDQDNSALDMFTYLTGNTSSQEITGMCIPRCNISRWISEV